MEKAYILICKLNWVCNVGRKLHLFIPRSIHSEPRLEGHFDRGKKKAHKRKKKESELLH